MNESQNEMMGRIKRTAERIYLDMTSQGDPRLATLKRTSTYQGDKLASLAGLVMELADALYTPEEVQPGPEVGPTREQLREAAQANRDNAAVRFSERLTYDSHDRVWFETRSGIPVLFTPYGWLREDQLDETDDRNIYVR